MDGWIEPAARALSERDRAGGGRAARTRMAGACLCAGLAIVFTPAVLGCAAAGLWIFTLPSLGPAGAPLVVAAALAAVVLGLAVAARLIMRHGRRGPDAVLAPQMSQLLLSEAAHLFNDNKGAALLAAVIAGMTASSENLPGRQRREQ
jgi:hypothetical protein